MDFKCVGVKFADNFGTLSEKTYSFVTNIKTLKKGDQVVVDTRYGLKVGVVDGYKEMTDIATKWVIQKIDTNQVKLGMELFEKERAKANKAEEELNKLVIILRSIDFDKTMLAKALMLAKR